jgi:hypothetical protein
MDTIVIVNASTVLTDAEVQAVIPGVQAQVSEDFAPLWGIDAKVEFAGQGTSGAFAGSTWALYVYDHTDTPGAGGYHTDDRGRVSGKVFAADAIEGGEAWTVDLTHELLEMLGDPSAGTDPSKFITIPDGSGDQCLREVGDAVEADEFAYQKLGVTVTDFVLPQYFYLPAVTSPAWPKGAPPAYDFMGHLTSGAAPTLLYGGYLGIRLPDGEWSQVSMFRKDGTRSRRALRDGGRTSYAAAQKP